MKDTTMKNQTELFKISEAGKEVLKNRIKELPIGHASHIGACVVWRLAGNEFQAAGFITDMWGALEAAMGREISHKFRRRIDPTPKQCQKDGCDKPVAQMGHNVGWAGNYCTQQHAFDER